MKQNETLGGDLVHAYTFGRLDAALGEHPQRFVNGPANLRAQYMLGYEATIPKLASACKIKGEFQNEFPWHKSNGSVDQIHAAAKARQPQKPQ